VRISYEALKADQRERRYCTDLKRSRQDLHKLRNRPKAHVYAGVLGYFITFRCYGTWLRGDQRGSIDWRHRAYKSPLLERDEERERKEFKALKHSPVLPAERRRMNVDSAIREVAELPGRSAP